MAEKYQLEEGQIVLCTVDKILGTTIFVKIDNNGEGTITTSEISPGRIRNLRDYVFPGKEIVCKVLRIQGDKIHLSFRRVKQHEKKELLDKIKKEKSYKALLKTVLGKEQSEETIKEITQMYSIVNFFEELKDNPKLLSKYTNKEQTEKILKILETKKDKPKEIKQNFKLSNLSSDGINTIKDILKTSCKDSQCSISYLAAGKYTLRLTGTDFKNLKQESNRVLELIESKAKKTNSEFSIEKN